MLNFKCTNCHNEIQSEYQYIGDMVECPICGSVQIVPDPILPNGAEFHGYMIGKTLASTMLWTTYEAVGRTELPDRHVVIRVPTTFFLKSVSDFEAFVDTVIKTGSLNMPEIPSLLDRSLVPGKIYFVYGYLKNTYKLHYFKGDRLLDYNSALYIVKGLATAMQKVWKKEGLIHQNMIPSNIRITNQLEVRIANIGISNFLLHDQKLLQHGFNIWDYRFMAPEFITDGIADSPSCDIYSLGGILFLLCTGHEPHENIDPMDITSAPIPSLEDYMLDAPESLTSLIQLMMAPNIQLRFKDWDEVIGRIDRIITDTTKMQKTDDVLEQYNMKGIQTGRYEPVGLQAGGFKKKVIKTSTNKIEQHVGGMTDTVAKLASAEEMKALNREWRNVKQTPHKKKRAKNKSNPTPYIFATMIVLVGLIAFIVVYFSAAAKKKALEQKYATTTETSETVPSPNKGTTDTNSSLVAEKTPSTPKKTPPRPKKVVTKKDSFVKQMQDIDAFLLVDPTKTKEALARYDALLSAAAKAKQFELVDKLQEKINQISDAETQKEAEKIKAVIAVIKKQILPLLKEEKYDEALKILREYDGELANESRRARLDLALQIEDRITKIKGNKEENSAAVKTYTAKFAPSLMQGKLLDAKIKMELGLKLEKSDLAKKLGKEWLVEVNNYEKLLKQITKAARAENIIDSPNFAEEMKDAYLLQALIFTKKEEYEAAKKAFKKLPYDAGDVFITFLAEKDADATFKKMLAKYEFKYETAQPSSLLLQLTQKTINKIKAENLKKDIDLFTEEYKDSKFLKKHSNLLDSLNTYCARITGEEQEAPEQGDIVLEPAEGTNDTGKTLRLALENAKTGAKIKLKKGEYRLNDLRIKQADLVLTGEKGASISANNIYISGHDIVFNNIEFPGGTVKIEKGAYNITFINCIFNGKETQVTNAKSITFKNSLIEGIFIEACKNILFNHCTILTPKGGIEAAIRIKSNNIEIADSIIHGEKYALMLMVNDTSSRQKHILSEKSSGGDSPRSRYIHHTLWFGEKALAVKKVGNLPIAPKDIITKSTKLRKFAKTKSNIHKPPQYVNNTKGDFRLVKGVPGSGKASDKKDCGALWGK